MVAQSLPTGAVRASHVLGLAWPVMVSMLSYNVMTLADTLFTGWLGTAELAAVGLSTTLAFFVLTPTRGLLRGVKILTSQRTGAQDEGGVQSLLLQGLWLALVLGFAVSLLFPWTGLLFQVFGASRDVAHLGAAYLGVSLRLALLPCFVWALEGWFQGRGDTRTPMVATLLGNAVNLALDPVLIFGLGPVPALGVTGAAWATAAALLVQLVVLAVRAWPFLAGASLAPRLAVIWRAVRFGGPLALQWTLDFGGFLVFMGMLARAGDAHLAAHVLVWRLVMVSVLPGFAMADAAGVLVGHAVGARRPAAAREAWWAGMWVASVLMGAFGVVFLLVPGWLILPFQPEPEVATLAVGLLAMAAVWQVFDAFAMVNFITLTAAGDTRFTLLVSTGGSWLLLVPLSAVFIGAMGLGVYGAWLALSLEIGVAAVISLARVRSRGWLDLAIQRVEEVPAAAPST